MSFKTNDSLTQILIKKDNDVSLISKYIASTICMIRPSNFAFNSQTATNNVFQMKLDHFTSKQIQDIALLEFDNMVNILKQIGINVIIFNDESIDTPDSIFPNNWFSTFTNEVILYSMYSVNRRMERKQHIYQTICSFLNKPINNILLNNEINNEILEGTGSLVCDYKNKIAFAAISPRTCSTTLNTFENIACYTTCRFHAKGPDNNLIYHTNVMMTICDQYVCF